MTMEVTANLSDESRPGITVVFAPGENLNDAVELYGEEVVFTRYRSAAVVDLQGYIRSLMKAKNEDGTFKHSDEQIQTMAAAWKPDVRKAGKSKLEKAEELVDKMSAEEIEALLSRLQAA